MEFLGNHNLFFSVIINGTHQFINKKINKNSISYKWFSIQNSQFDNYRTQYIIEAQLIEIDVLKKVLIDLFNIYKKENPFSTSADFEANMLGYSKYFLKKFIEMDFRFLASPEYVSSDSSIYSHFDNIDKQYIVLIIPNNRSVSFFKQYYNKVIQLIDELVFTSREKTIDSKSEKLQKNLNSIYKLDSNKTEKKTNQNNSLPKLIRSSKSEVISREIKIKYKNIRGKELKFLLIALQELQLIPEIRFAKKFHEGCKIYFGWDINSYQAMNDYIVNEKYDREIIDQIKTFIEKLI